MCRKLSICALAKIGTSIIDVVEAPQVHPFGYTEWVDLRDFPHAKLPTNLAGPAWWAVGDSEMTAISQCQVSHKDWHAAISRAQPEEAQCNSRNVKSLTEQGPDWWAAQRSQPIWLLSRNRTGRVLGQFGNATHEASLVPRRPFLDQSGSKGLIGGQAKRQPSCAQTKVARLFLEGRRPFGKTRSSISAALTPQRAPGRK